MDPTQVSRCGICGGQRRNGTGFSSSTSFSPVTQFTSPPYLSVSTPDPITRRTNGRSLGKGKDNPRTDHERPEREQIHSSILPSTSTLVRMSDQRHAPVALSPGKTMYPLYRRLDGSQGRSGRVRKISSSPGFDPRTVQPVVSHYTDCGIPAPYEVWEPSEKQ